MNEHGPGPDDTWQLLRDKDVKWICSRLSRAQMTMPPASLDALDWMWQQRYAQDTPILLDALTRGEQRIAALEAALARAVVEARDRQWQAKQREEGEELMLTNDMILTPTELRARLVAAEATGRAAVWALRAIGDDARAAALRVASKPYTTFEQVMLCELLSGFAAAVLATDTAKRWLKEVPDGGTQSNC